MHNSHIKHLITGNELSKDEIYNLLSLASELKKDDSSYSNALQGKHIAICFEKPSLRTRFSFSAAINNLGAHTIESVSQTRKNEEPKDFIRVIQGYCDAMMIRTFDDNDLLEMKQYTTIPIINGLTNTYHPCQSLADLLTLKECFNTLDYLKIAYIGDGNNVLNSLLMMATKLGIEVHYCCPKGHEPTSSILDMLEKKNLAIAFDDTKEAVKDCDAVYADVWTSMGFKENDEDIFSDYQVNEKLMSHAKERAIFMHCMPMERGKEVSINLPDAKCSVIFQQSKNRMHVQQALLLYLLNKVT